LTTAGTPLQSTGLSAFSLDHGSKCERKNFRIALLSSARYFDARLLTNVYSTMVVAKHVPIVKKRTNFIS
jgi:hypothetical protein